MHVVVRNRAPAGHRTRIRHIGDDLVAKAEAVGEDTAAGGAVGGFIGTAIFPGIGSAAGAAIGTAAGAIYGAIDNFGGDAVKFLGLNPPAFTEEKYQWERGQCEKSGGHPTPGVAPDVYGGCTYGDGAVSGGDVPFPGTWNGDVIDRDVYSRAKAEIDRLAAPPEQPVTKGPTLQRINASVAQQVKSAIEAQQQAKRQASLAHLQQAVSQTKVRTIGPTAAMVQRTESLHAPPSKPLSTPVKVAAGVSGVGAVVTIAWGLFKLLGRR